MSLIAQPMSRRSAATIAVACAFLWAGCGGDDEAPETAAKPPPPAATPANSLPGFQTPLESGTTYTTEQFQPAVRITVPDDGEWTTEVGDTPEHFSVLTKRDFGQALLAVHRIARVYDPEKGGVEPGDAVPLTVGFAEWLTGHPHLETEEPQPVELLGRSGVQIDFATRSSPPRTPDQACGHAGDDCVPFFYDGLDTIAYGKQVKGRFIVVPLDDGEIVLELYASPAAAFDHAVAVLRPLLESLELA